MSSHHEWVEEVIAQHNADRPFAPENGNTLQFKVGDKVIFTNDYGASFNQTITALYQPETVTSLYATGHRYLLDTDCHWMPVKEDHLKLAV